MKIEGRVHQRAEHLTKLFHRKPKWYLEVIFVGVLYSLYSYVRNIKGSTPSEELAKRHALDIVHAEQWLHIFNEKPIQDLFLHSTAIIKFLNVWYGTAHFIVTPCVMLWLFFHFPHRYHKWRNVIFFSTFFALIGYYIYPLAPPRLLPASFAFEDTLKTIGGFWDFNSKQVEHVSNQYAAMPSLHVCWSLWCALAMIAVVKHRAGRVAFAIYPAITITAIVVTANHYWMDVFGGAFVLSLGYVLAETLDRRRVRKLVESEQITDDELADIKTW